MTHKNSASRGAVALVVAVGLVLMGTSVAFAWYDPYDGNEYEPAPFAPYTEWPVGPTVDTYAHSLGVPVFAPSESAYAPYTEGPAIGTGPKDEHRYGHFPID